MPGITFSGLATGLDTGAIVDQLVGLAKTPINRLQTKRTTLDGRAKKLASLSSKLGDLAKATTALSTTEKAAPTKATGSDDSVFLTRGTGGASAGRFSIKVVALASADRYYANPVAERNQAGLFGSGTLSLSVGAGAAVDVSVEASDTLDSLASKINASGAGVSASVLNTGSGYRLQIAGSQTGAANAVTITETGPTLGFGSVGNHVATAVDANVEIDGFTVTRPTNTIEGAIPGVTLDLKSTSPVGTTQNVEVARDQGTLVDRLKLVVSSWNIVSSFIDSESAASVTGGVKPSDSLGGDASVRTVQQRLRTIATSPVAGATGRYTTLASLGISVQRTGQLALDETKLAAAIAADPDAVTRVLSGDTGVMSQLNTAIEAWTDPSNGLLDARTDAIRGQQRQIDDQIEALTRRLDAYETLLRNQFTKLETTMSGLNNQGSQITAALQSLS